MTSTLVSGFAFWCFVMSSVAAQAQSLTVRLNAEPETLDWNLARSSHETYVLMNIMDGLVHLNTHTNQPEPALAQSWKFLDGGKKLVFELKQGVRWTDGKELLASHFVKSWKRLQDPKLKAPYQNHLRALKSFRAVGKYQLELILHAPSPQILYLLSFWVTFPMREDIDPKLHFRTTLGPYLVKNWEPTKQIVLQKNPNYGGSRKVSQAAPEQVNALIVPDDQHARDLLEKGQIDVFFEANTKDLIKLSQAPGAESGNKARIEQFPYLATYYLGFNAGRAPFKNKKLRQAFAAVVDTATQLQALQGGQKAARSWLPPGVLPEGIEPTSVQLEDIAAQRLLADEGFPAGKGFPVIELWVEKFDGAEKLAAALVESWKKRLGVEVKARVAASALDFQKGLREGRAAFFVNHWGADFPDASNFFEVFIKGGPGRTTGWNNPRYDQKVAQAGATLDVAKRVALYLEAEKILVSEEAVIAPLFFKKNVVMVNPRVTQLHVSPLNYFELNEVEMSQESNKL